MIDLAFSSDLLSPTEAPAADYVKSGGSPQWVESNSQGVNLVHILMCVRRQILTSRSQQESLSESNSPLEVLESRIRSQAIEAILYLDGTQSWIAIPIGLFHPLEGFVPVSKTRFVVSESECRYLMLFGKLLNFRHGCFSSVLVSRGGPNVCSIRQIANPAY
jgi:hypothetical protein